MPFRLTALVGRLSGVGNGTGVVGWKVVAIGSTACKEGEGAGVVTARVCGVDGDGISTAPRARVADLTGESIEARILELFLRFSGPTGELTEEFSDVRHSAVARTWSISLVIFFLSNVSHE